MGRIIELLVDMRGYFMESKGAVVPVRDSLISLLFVCNEIDLILLP